MKTIIVILSIGILSFLISQILIPVLSRLAIKIDFVDRPNYRKVHQTATPLVGGLSIAISVFFVILISQKLIDLSSFIFMLASGFILLIMGCLDDKHNISAKTKLALELLLAFLIALSGIRISSLHGFLGIYEIGVGFQYILTVLIISGVVNAINLIDGVDGLAGSYVLLGFIMFMGIGIYMENYSLAFICAAFIGALVSFLKDNLLSKRIFMGDSGALFLGLLLVTMGIQVLEQKPIHFKSETSFIFMMLVAFFTIPVLDSIRVYLGRIKTGYSPFHADKSHLHHLLLQIGLKKWRLIVKKLEVVKGNN